MYPQQASCTQGLWPAALPQPHLHSFTPIRPPYELILPLYPDVSKKSAPAPPSEGMSSVAPLYQQQQASGRHQERAPYFVESRDTFRRGHDNASDASRQVQQPVSTSRQPSPTHSHHSHNSSVSHGRKSSQASLIAPALQIPRTINNSQGSLSELAAQITCLFWFESSAVLDQAEDTSASPLITQSLNPDTIPTTGFRKWVTTILSTTQVAQNVIVLALLFIYRLKKQNPSVKGKPGSEYRLLTVALMLGNKFLDDNTYTNRTWADVSGISVAEVQVMEVEFLSNMKYSLFTSSEQWANWQTQLGRFASFLERVSQASQAHVQPPKLTRPVSSYGAATLPSPPNSHQASPPRAPTPLAQPPYYNAPLPSGSQHLTARPSPMVQNGRKRSLEDDGHVNAAKRVVYEPSGHGHQQLPSFVQQTSRQVDTASQPSYSSQYLPSISAQRMPTREGYAPNQLTNQLPPLMQQLRSSASGLGWQQQPPASSASTPSAMATALRSAQASRTHSPYLSSTNVSPTNMAAMPTSVMHPQMNQSPSIFLAKRDSPYKPVRAVHTLLVPPPSRTMHQPGHVGQSQMHYQPLGRPIQERQQGHLPYIAQNQWFEGGVSNADTPFGQWNGMQYSAQPPMQRGQGSTPLGQ